MYMEDWTLNEAEIHMMTVVFVPTVSYEACDKLFKSTIDKLLSPP